MGLIMQNGISYGGVDIVKLTQAEYDALPESKNSDGILYAITDGEGSSGGGSSKPVELTKAQYEALGESTKTDGILYAITDGDELSAKNLEYDGSVTGLGNNVQDAIDGLNSNLGNIRFGVDGDGNYGYYGADDSLIPFSKSISGIVSKTLSAKYTATKDGIYAALANIVYPQSYGLPSWSTTGTIIKSTSGTAENHYGTIACIVNLKKGDTITAINPYPNSTYGGCIIFCP